MLRSINKYKNFKWTGIFVKIAITYRGWLSIFHCSMYHVKFFGIFGFCYLFIYLSCETCYLFLQRNTCFHFYGMTFSWLWAVKNCGWSSDHEDCVWDSRILWWDIKYFLIIEMFLFQEYAWHKFKHCLLKSENFDLKSKISNLKIWN